ncbi:MAG: hypothetical protein QFX33_00725 [Candidatus Nezhaarchaeota archaeon]|nr:hypothetical protein [Candidatus Nezhaarchaeota archaeon]
MRPYSRSSRGRWSIEGGYVETVESLIFTAKGLVHPPGMVVAYLRYMAEKGGGRVRRGVEYRRVQGLEEQVSIVKLRYPHYFRYDPVWDVEVQAVPLERVARVYDPVEGLKELMKEPQGHDRLAEAARRFAEELKSASGIDEEHIGVSGSLLLSLHGTGSDLDFVVYGAGNAFKAREALRKLLDEGESFRRFNNDEMRALFASRSSETPMDFRAFSKQEGRKVIQGVYRGFVYFIRFVQDPGEVGESYGERVIRGLGEVKMRARVVDDSESMFTPCTYTVECTELLEGAADPGKIREVTSFRGRFAEQALRGEEIEVKGRLEEVSFRCRLYHRVVVGLPGDYMVSLNCL